MKAQNGLTLIELMTVVAIMALLATIALPMYNDYVTRGKIPEATANLSDLRVKMEQWYQDNRFYTTAAGGAVCGVTMPVAPVVKYFTFACNVPGGDQTYTLTATGTASMAGFAYTIDQSNAKSSTLTGTPAAGGWKSNATCWVTRKGGSC